MSWTRHLRLKHLDLLVTLAETGSLSEAAKRTFTTQPALSRWLKELEEDSGGELFERHARGLKPTAMGRMLIAHARRITTEIERAQHNLEAIQAGGARQVSVGTSPAAAPSFVPAAISRFMQMHPKSSVEVQEGTMNMLLEKLHLGELDVVVGRLDNYKPRPDIRNEILYREQIRVVCRPDHPLTGIPQVSWNDLYQYEWIVWPDGTPIRTKFDTALTNAGLKPPHYRISSSSLVSNLWLLKYNDMLSVVSERVAAHFHERGLMVVLDVELECDAGPIGMCWRDEEHPDDTIEDLLECCRALTGLV